MLETKFLSVSLSAGSETDPEGTISGYGSVFGQKDQGSDIVVAGAFARSLKTLGRMPVMLFGHNPNEPVGVWDRVEEDEKGLLVKGRLALGTQRGREAHDLVKMGALSGLSIGYRTIRADFKGDARLIQEVELWEISLVSFPMLDSARIDAVKAAELTDREIERKLTQDAGFTRSVARALMSGGIKAIRSERDAGQEQDLSELRALLEVRANLSSTR